MAKTKEQRLGTVFDLLVDDLTARIKNGEATSTDLNVARQMLKDNGITAAPIEASPLEGLGNALPFPAADELKEATGGQ
tara:strand:+ start:123 stop:359 length:237 start_codon:yes stop_codon:yes gene_type:complete